MRKLSFAAIGVVAALTLAGCAGGGASPEAETSTGDLRVWLVGTDTPAEARDYSSSRAGGPRGS